MKLTRRKTLGLLAIGGGAAAFGGYSWSRGNFSGPPRALAIPPQDQGVVRNGARQFDLAMGRWVSQFFDNINTPTFGINGAYLGPTLRMRKGETVRMKVQNDIGRASTLHWHGMHLPARSDGGPHQVVQNGTGWVSEFEVKQNAATVWYHSHMVPETGFQVNQGLAGMILIEDEQSGNLGLPDSYGVDDIPLVLQDRRFAPDGSFEYMTSMHDRMMGMRGDKLLVNGTYNPYFIARSDTLRLRVLNGSNARFYTLAFDDGRIFSQIASDGGLLERPNDISQITLGPGERAELIVDVSDGTPAMLQNRTSIQGVIRSFDVLDIRPDTNRTRAKTIPSRLITLPKPDPGVAVRTRKLVLGMERRMGGGKMTINGQEMALDRIDQVVRVGTSEIWEIDNPTVLPHPIHIHDVQFRILDRNGALPSLGEQGLKDTVVVYPGEKVRVLLSFADYTDPDRPYMYHCHILEHEDAGMMGQFTVVS
jgi:FtsP/CotA-like multicopper oxidase with cupredoxin domain